MKNVDDRIAFYRLSHDRQTFLKMVGMKPIQERFGITVRLRREELGISQEELAETSGIHRTYASSIERGRVTVSIDVAERVACSLQLSLSELFQLMEQSKR